jgi:phosphate transport system substrate-binding protein
MKAGGLWNVAALLILYLLGPGCKAKVAEQVSDRFDSGVIHISCDESFKPVIDAQVKVYEAAYPKTRIIVHYKAEAACLRDFAVDSIKMIIATRGFTKSEEAFIGDSLKVNPSQATVAYDAIAVVVHPSAEDTMFSMKEIKALVTGKTKKNLIPVFDGVSATSTVRFMLDSVLKGESLGPNVVAARSSEGVIDYIAATPNAVGFIGINWVASPEDSTQRRFLKKIKIARLESTDVVNGYVLPAQIFIYTRGYPMIRSLIYTLKEKHNGLAHGFANFLTLDRGQLIFRRAYIFPALRSFYTRDAELQQD